MSKFFQWQFKVRIMVCITTDIAFFNIEWSRFELNFTFLKICAYNRNVVEILGSSAVSVCHFLLG